jgi:hypothetical protein
MAIDTKTAPTVDTEDAPAAQPGIRDAGRAFLEGLKPEEREKPFSAEELAETAGAATAADSDDDELDAADTPKPEAKKEKKKPEAKADAPKTEDEAVVESTLQREDGATWNESAKRWQSAAGAFVEGEAPSEEELAELAEAKKVKAAPTAAPAKTEGEDEAKPIKVSLRGRNDEELEVEVSDPQIAEILRANAKDGLRRREYNERIQEVEGRELELQGIEQALEIDPVGFTISHMTPSRQLEVAEALLLEHFDTLKPKLEQWYEDAAARNGERVALRDKMKETGDQLSDTQARLTHARNCMRAAEAIIPETTDHAAARAFMRDAERDLTDAARSGEKITPETVAQLLAPRAKLYGFAEGAGTTAAPATKPATPPTPTESITARPVTDRAKEIADRGQEKVEQARAAQKRVRVVQTQRRAASKVAPPGVGAATVRVPLIDPKATIKEASKAVRQAGLASWPTMSG